MSNILSPVRAREAGENWLADRRLALPTPPRVSAAWAEQAMVDGFVAGWGMATAPESEAEVNAILAGLIRDAQAAGTDEAADDAALRIKAYLGAIHREEQDQWAIERATGQRQLDDARALMVETAELLRGYEEHHRAKVPAEPGNGLARFEGQLAAEKADRNALAASRLEAWVRGEDRYPVQASENPAEVLRGIAERTAEECGLTVDHASFDQAAARLAETPGEDSAVAHGQVIDLPGVTSREQAERLARHDDPTRFTPVPGFTGLDPEILEALQATAGETAALDPVGLPVSKRGGDYEFDGEIRAVIPKRSGEVRYAVEDDRGLLLIMNARQCGLPDAGRRSAPHHRPGGVADLLAFRVTTGDPRFDPLAPVCVNGYLYHPTKEA